jgi:repressor LexA
MGKMLAPLTPKQKQILEFIRVYQQANSISPSLEEIRNNFNLRAVSTVHEHIEKLKSKGYLRKEMNQARGIRTTDHDSGKENMLEIDLLGNIAAGSPIEAVENAEPLTISRDLLPGLGKYYALRVKGESMIEDGIYDGDIVIIKSQQTAENGDPVVAIVEDGLATLKRFYKEKGVIRLQPANSTLKPMYYKHVEIRGKMVALVRKYE